MKRKLTAIALAVFMAVTPVGNAAAGEVMPDGDGYEEIQAAPEKAADSEAGQDCNQINSDQCTAENNSVNADREEETQSDGIVSSESEAFAEPGDDVSVLEENSVPVLEEDSAFVQPESVPSVTGDYVGTGQPEDEQAESGTQTGPEGIIVDDFLVAAEAVDPNEEGLMEETAPELSGDIVEQLAASGYASDAQRSEERTFYGCTYVDSYGGQLSGDARNVYNAMKAAYVDSRNPVQDDSELSIAFAVHFSAANKTELAEVQDSVRSIMQSAFDAFIYDYPEAFWMDAPSFLYNFSSLNYPTTVTGVTLKPRMIYKGAGMEVPAFDQAVKTAYQAAMQGKDVSTASGKVKAIHDYLCDRLSYGEGTTELSEAYAHSAAGVFLSNTGLVVCEGYAKAFKLLCQEAGFSSALIVGEAGGPHMWNYVKMDDGNWYMVDVTWDDTAGNLPVTTYFLTGAFEQGVAGYTIAGERIIFSKFSESIYSKHFGVPILSRVRYEDRGVTAGHCHNWEPVEDTNCTQYKYLLSECTICHVKTMQIFEPTGHCFEEGNYVYNNDATCTKDGTSTLYCDHGCGTKASDLQAKTSYAYTIRAKGTATGHRFVKYVSDNNAGWNCDGTKTAVCENGCGTKNTVDDPGSAKIPTIKLNLTSLTLKKGQSTTALKVSGLAKGDKIKNWKSDNTKIVKVNSKGKITAQKKTGKAKVTVTLDSGLKKSITVKVQSGAVKTTKISGVEKTLTLSPGKKKALTPVVSPVTSQEKLTYSSSDKKVATVSSKGVITAKGSGKAKITVKSGSKKAVVTVTVPKLAPKKITNIAASLTLKRGKSKTLKPKLSPSGSQAKITYASSDKSVASVSSAGKITAKKKGKAVITVKAGNVSVKCKVTVK